MLDCATIIMDTLLKRGRSHTLRLCFAPAACPIKVSREVQVTLHTLHFQGARAERNSVPLGSAACWQRARMDRQLTEEIVPND